MKKFLKVVFIIFLINCFLSIVMMTGLRSGLFDLIDETIEKNAKEKIYYELNDNGNSYKVKGVSYGKNDNFISIPSEYKNKPVTGISAKAFYEDKNLKSIEIPNTITRIEREAFYGCENLVNVYISDITSWCECEIENGYVGSNPLQYAKNFYLNGELITELIIPSGVEQIRESVFSNYSNLTEVTIPDSVKIIGDYAFSNCTSLINVTIFDGVEHIGEGTFNNCASLINVTIPNTLKSIGSKAFYNCTALANITMPDTLANIGSEAFCNCTALTNIAIPNSVTFLGGGAFFGCSSLTNVQLGNGITDIYTLEYFDSSYFGGARKKSNGMFEGCTSLINISIPSTIVNIEYEAFAYCEKLASLIFEGSTEDWKSIRLGEYWNYKTLISKVVCTNGTITYSIGNNNGGENNNNNTGGNNNGGENNSNNTGGNNSGAGTGATAAKLIYTYGNSQQSYYAVVGPFYQEYIANITLVTIPSTHLGKPVRVILNGAFSGCSALKTVVIDEGVQTIHQYAFKDCSALTNITIPSSVTTIDYAVFQGCSKLTTITFRGTIDQWNAISKNHFWDQNTGNYTIYCTDGTIAKSGTINNDYSKGLEFYFLGRAYVVNGIGTCRDEEIIIPASYNSYPVIGIDVYAFSNENSFTKVTIPDSITYISNFAFDSCNNLISITIGNGVTKISDNAFSGCTSLTSIRIGKGVTSIEDMAFAGCDNLTNISYSGTVAEWNTIILGDYWNYYIPATQVTCSDGVVELN